jgi:hypothetical protein
MANRVYVSSTYADLKDHRAAVCDVLAKMRYTHIAMEDYVARDARVRDECLRDVAACDIYLGIFGFRYGHTPRDDNPEGLSITELEYRHAKALNKPRLLFVLDPAAPWPDASKDSVTGDGHAGADIQRLRNDVSRDRMPGLFRTVHDLAVNAAASLHLQAADARTRALSSDLASASCLTLQSSTRSEIVDNIKRAISENARTDVIKINLGTGQSWWSTRVHLLSALCGDYTEVRQLLFEEEGYRFVGMCTPSQARRLLARQFPVVETAYRESMPSPDQVSFDPVDEVREVVDRFSAVLDARGGELAIKEWVPPHVVRNWPGVTRPRLDIEHRSTTPDLVSEIVQRDDPFVVLVRGPVVHQVVDRAALATRLAVAGP